MINITKLERFKGKTWIVTLSDGDSFSLGEDIVFAFDLKEKTELSEEKIEEIKHAETMRKARERALYLLDFREFSFVELCERLEKKCDSEVALETVKDLAEAGIIDDVRYAKNLAEKYLKERKFSIIRTKREMISRGLSREIIDDVLFEYDDESEQRLREFVSQKYASKIVDKKSLERVRNSLVRRGYAYSDIKTVLAEYEEDLPMEDD